MNSMDTSMLEQLRREAEARVAEKARQVGGAAATENADAADGAAPAAAPAVGAAAPQEGMPIDWSTEPTPAYANGLQVAYSVQDFALLFTELTRFPGRLAPGNQPGKERARVAASLRINPEAYFQMLCVMASTWNQFVGEVVDPRMRQPKFKLLDAGDAQLDGLTPKQRGEG
ncbi:MAG: hypothetical protein R3B07_07890 [Polyangiaceae bacterium]